MRYLKLLRHFFALALMVYAGLLLVVYFEQRSMIYYPTDQVFNSCFYLPSRSAEPITYGGTRMYVHKAASSTGEWIVFYHGNAGSACDRFYITEFADPGRFSYIIPEYSGYSADSSSPSETEILKNVRDTVSFLAEQKPASVFVVGESIGTAPAAYHSSISPADKLALLSPFPSLTEVSQYHYPYMPVKLMLKDRYPVNTWNIRAGKVLVVHGTADDTVPFELGKKLFDSLGVSDKQFVAIKGGGHNDLYDIPLATTTLGAFIAGD